MNPLGRKLNLQMQITYVSNLKKNVHVTMYNIGSVMNTFSSHLFHQKIKF